jgi:hypothetical protein
MTERKRRFKTSDELDPGEHLAVIRAKRVGAPTPKFERGDYRAAKVAALRDHGLEEEAEQLEEAAAVPKSPAGHLAHIRRQHAAPGRSPRAA